MITYADIQQLHEAGQTAAQIAAALNTPQYEVVDNTPGGYKKAASVLTDEELETFLAVMEKFSRSEDNKVGIVAHVLRQFSLGVLDFSSPEAQKLFSALMDVGVSKSIGDKLMRVGIRTESDADQRNGGVPYTDKDVQAIIDEHVALELRSTLANYLASKVQVVQDAIEAGAVTTEAGVDAALSGGK